MNDFDALFYLRSAGWSMELALLMIREVKLTGELTFERLRDTQNDWFVRMAGM